MPSKKKKNKQKRSKTARATKKASRPKRGVKQSRLKKVAKKKQSKTKTAKARVIRRREGSVNEAEALGLTRRRPDTVSGRQSGDLQGLSRAEQADSESVDELVEEGNLFEAGAVAGVEEADNADQREVHTHEVPEDDVPEEYLDKE
jgi:uncharacterized surface protein with fasciclin (FAS1) repeats